MARDEPRVGQGRGWQDDRMTRSETAARDEVGRWTEQQVGKCASLPAAAAGQTATAHHPVAPSKTHLLGRIVGVCRRHKALQQLLEAAQQGQGLQQAPLGHCSTTVQQYRSAERRSDGSESAGSRPQTAT
jgi:hypothetical protein